MLPQTATKSRNTQYLDDDERDQIQIRNPHGAPCIAAGLLAFTGGDGTPWTNHSHRATQSLDGTNAAFTLQSLTPAPELASAPLSSSKRSVGLREARMCCLAVL
jgi:hypothetical protein